MEQSGDPVHRHGGQLKPIWLVRFFSGVLIFIGIVAFAYNMMATVIGRREYAAVRLIQRGCAIRLRWSCSSPAD